MSARQWMGRRLRSVADVIDRDHAPAGLHWTFTFEEGEGIKFREDGRGCRLWYLSEKHYDKAFSDADHQPPRVHWDTMTVSYPDTHAPS